MRVLRWVAIWFVFKKFKWLVILLGGTALIKRYLDDNGDVRSRSSPLE